MAQDKNALQVVNLQDAALVQLTTAEVRTRLSKYLKRCNSKWEPDDLLLGLADLMTATPDIKKCTPTSLFSALIYTAQRGLNFGMGGVWLQPRDISDPSVPKAERANAPKIKTAVCVMDYRAMEEIAAERCGLQLPFTTIFVYPDETAEVVMERGSIADIKHKIKPERNRTQVDFLWGYTVCNRKDGSAPFIYIMDKESLEKRRKTGASDGDAWTKWGVEMYTKTLERKTATVLVKDFTGGVPSETGEYEASEPIDVTEETNKLTRSEKLIQDLKGENRQEGPKTGQQSKVEPSGTQPPPKGENAQPEGGQAWSAAQLEEIENTMASYASQLEGSLKEKTAALMEWVNQRYADWLKQGSDAQVKTLVKARDQLIGEFRKQG